MKMKPRLLLEVKNAPRFLTQRCARAHMLQQWLKRIERGGAGVLHGSTSGRP
jgi:hypothetical protein